MKGYAMLKIGESAWIEKERPKCGPMDAICRRQFHDSLFFLIQRGDGLLMILRCGDVFSYNCYG